MNREEQFDKNLELAREFFVGLLDQPLETWPESGTTIVFTPDDDPELTRANLAMLDASRERNPEQNGNVVYYPGSGSRPTPKAKAAGAPVSSDERVAT